MRIIAGELGGRTLKTIDRPGLRPTTDRVREALFSSLDSEGVIEDARVLDLYAGTGSLGLEALSRGASTCAFVEFDPRTGAQLKRVVSEFGLESRARVVVGDVLKTLSAGAKAVADMGPFDLIFADPPYDDHPGLLLAEKLLAARILRQGSFLVMESRSTDDAALSEESDRSLSLKRVEGLSPKLQKVKVYGDTQLHFYRFEETNIGA